MLSLFFLIATASQAATPPAVVLTQPNGTAVTKPAESPKADEQFAQTMADDVARQMQAGKTRDAQTLRDKLIEQFPGTTAGSRALEQRARDRVTAKAVAGALDDYAKLLFYNPTYENSDTVRTNYSRLLLEVGRYDEAAAILQALYKSTAHPEQHTEFGLLLAKALESAKKYRAALELYTQLYNSSGTSAAQRTTLQERAVAAIASGLTFEDAIALWDDAKSDDEWQFVAGPLAYRLARIYYHIRDYDRAEQMLRLIGEQYSKAPYATEAADFLRLLQARSEVNVAAVGVVLPLSGRYQQYGERALQAIQLAVAGDPNIKLFVKDSRGEPVSAAQAVEELVVLHQVIAIIGPLFSSEAVAAANKAEELSVPLLCLSHQDGIPQIGPNVFRTALTVQAQAAALAKVAFEQLGYKRFALLYPKTRYGMDFVKAFWNEVTARQGEIRGAEAYDPDQTTFRDPIRKLVGRYYLGARTDYRDAVANLRSQGLTPLQISQQTEKIDKGLSPVIDFDAIVIPDSGRKIGLIAPALAVEDVVMTRDPKVLAKVKKATGREDITPVTLLGGSTWNSQQTVESCEQYCEDAVFVDAFYPSSNSLKVREFVVAFKNATGADAFLSEAQAYDTAGLVKWVLKNSHPKSRKAFRETLGPSLNYDGITGRFSFDDAGDVRKDLFTLTIKGGAIRLFDRAAFPSQG